MNTGKTRRIACLVAVLLCLSPQFAFAAQLDGATLSLWWGAPFAATLLSIAIAPVVAPIFWDHHYGKVIVFWTLSFLIPFTYFFGFEISFANLVHALVAEYIPFILLLVALFAVVGGIFIQTDIKATPFVNVGILLLGTCLASFMGTTGASMLLIRPLLRANAERQRRTHIVIFFIFLVSNIGGVLTPLGDPPLFLGFLKGISFFWSAQHLWPQALFLSTVLLVIFFALDSFMLSLERKGGAYKIQAEVTQAAPQHSYAFSGHINFVFLGCIIGLVLLSGVWRTEAMYNIFGTHVGLPGLVRDVGLIAVTFLSLKFTSKKVRKANEFDWGPMQEVAKLFAGIFLTIVPVIVMLRAGVNGAFASIVSAVTDTQGEPIPFMYFWATGVLSSFLDNAPTYLVFFNTASGDPNILMTTMASTLMAISAGAVFMGANTYIGNAPNLMVKAIADHAGVKMPSFFGYMAWSFGILIPLFVLISFIWYT